MLTASHHQIAIAARIHEELMVASVAKLAVHCGDLVVLRLGEWCRGSSCHSSRGPSHPRTMEPPLLPQLPQAYRPIQACAACSHCCTSSLPTSAGAGTALVATVAADWPTERLFSLAPWSSWYFAATWRFTAICLCCAPATRSSTSTRSVSRARLA